MKRFGWLFALLPFVSLTFFSLVFAAPEESEKVEGTEDYVKEFEEMFKSPYQEVDYYRTDRLLLTATGTLKPIHRAPSVASVITAEDIERIGAKNLDEALEMVPGLHVSVSNKDALSPIYVFRGIHTSVNPQVLLMINNIPVKSIYFGRRPQLILPVASIARIEVVRGPGSAVYGADAFAGTINIITKEVKDIEGSTIGGGGGSFDTYEGWIQHGKSYGGWDVTFSLEYQTSNGDDDRIVDADLQSTLDDLFRTSASHAPGKLHTGYDVYNVNFSLVKDNWRLRLWGNDQAFETRDGVTSTLDNEGEGEIQEYLADLSYRTGSLMEDLELNSRLSFHYYKQDSKLQLFPDGAILLIGTDGNIDFNTPGVPVIFAEGVWGEPVQIEKQTAIEITGLYEGIKQHLLRLSTGFEYNRAEFEEYKNFGPGVLENPNPGDIQGGVLTDVTGTEDIFIPNKTRKLWYVSLQDEWTFAKKWELTAGVRYDEYSDFGSTR
jgi:iron complex outermembrane receptor protein